MKARVLTADLAARRLSLSLVPAKQAALSQSDDGNFQNEAQTKASAKAGSKAAKMGSFGGSGAEIDALGGLQPGDVVQGFVVQQQAEVSAIRRNLA